MKDNLPNSPAASDPLDALLCEGEVHLPDDGFTARVITSLPPRRHCDRLRLALFAAAWLAGVVILLRHTHAIGAVAIAFVRNARQGDVGALLAVAPIAIAIGALVWALVTWALEEWA